MTLRIISMGWTLGALIAVGATSSASAADPQSGVLPSYRTQAPKITARVASQAGLMAALASAGGGEVIGLAPGNYSLQLVNRTYSAPVTITSANPDKFATFKSIDLKAVSNITFSRLEITRSAPEGTKMGGGNDNIFIAEVVDGSNVVFDANYIHGSLDNDATNDMSGLKVSGTRGAKVINNEFEQVGRGVVFGSVRDVIVANNMVHRIRSDGFNFAQSKRLLIEGNYFTASQRARWDHPDAIQFWTARTKSPSTDIMIRNNEIIQGKGSGTQGIFMKDETDQLPYERVTIENNLMIGSVLLNGIYVQNARNLRIVNNTVISPTDLKDSVWIRLLKVKDVEFEGNIAERGGNKTPREAKVNMKMMKNDTFRDVKPEDVIVPGFGYQKPQ